MNEIPITLSSLATIAAISAAVFGIIVQLLKFGFEFLSAKFTPINKTDEASLQQSTQCHYDHQNISGLIATQNANIAKMLAQNQELITSIITANHTAELRHQGVLNKLEMMGKTLEHTH